MREIFSPRIKKEVLDDLDRTSLRNISVIAFVTFLFESIGMLTSIPNLEKLNKYMLGSVFYCMGVSLCVFIFAHIALEKRLHNHSVITVFSIVASLMYIVWGMMVSYYHYTKGEQILTFFTVIIALMFAVVIKPYIMMLIFMTSFIAYWIVLYRFNECKTINEFNYFTMLIVIVTGSVVLYHNVLNRSIEKNELNAVMEHAQNDLIKQDLELSNAKIKLMQTSMKPHFIFNMLGVIRALIWEDREKAAKSINDFSVYLRSNIDAIESDEQILFSDELLHVKAFVALENTETSNLNVEYNIETESFLIPPLTVEPLVENALIHGFRKKDKDKRIVITTKDTQDSYVVVVADNGTGFDVKNVKERVGIRNVRQRLMYSCRGTLVIESDSSGTTAIITIPKKERGHE